MLSNRNSPPGTHLPTMKTILLVGLAVAISLAAAQVPPPIVAYTVNPDPTHKGNNVPSSTPLVLSSTAAFVCYADYQYSLAYCQFVSPANAAFVAPRTVLNTTNFAAFDEPPLPISPETALYSTRWPDKSYYAFSSSEHVAMPANRFGSTAACASNPNNFSAYVPFGVHMGDDFVLALNVTHVETTPLPWEYHVAPWSEQGKTYPNGLSLLHDVIYYHDLLLFVHNNTFYKYNATTGAMIFSVPNPCGVVLGVDAMNLAKGTFGQDANGDLDAFIVYGNTTSVAGHAEFTVCRVSHNSGSMTWRYTLAEDFQIYDVTGGCGVLLLSGRQLTAGALNYVTLILDAGQNVSYGFIPRASIDFQSYPTFIPQSQLAVGCGPGIALQKNNNLTVYCLNPILGNRTVRDNMQLWNVPVECEHRPLYDPISTQIVCVSLGKSASSVLAANGALVWTDATRQLMTQPVLMIELGVSYAFILDIDATLYGYQIPLVAPTLAPQTLPPSPPTPAPQGGSAPEEGMSGGAAAGVAIGVIVIVAALGFFGYQYATRRRRQAYQATNLNQEYGSLS